MDLHLKSFFYNFWSLWSRNVKSLLWIRPMLF